MTAHHFTAARRDSDADLKRSSPDLLVLSEVVLIWAQARNTTIGFRNALPWHIPEDLKHFKERTAGHPVIMGRRTWDSLQPPFRPLPGRRNIVLSHDDAWTGSDATRAADFEEALRIAGPGRVFVIGGAHTYRAAMPYADRLEVTEIDEDFPGDTYAPEIDRARWHLTRDGEWQHSSAGIGYRFRTYLTCRSRHDPLVVCCSP